MGASTIASRRRDRKGAHMSEEHKVVRSRRSVQSGCPNTGPTYVRRRRLLQQTRVESAILSSIHAQGLGRCRTCAQSKNGLADKKNWKINDNFDLSNLYLNIKIITNKLTTKLFYKTDVFNFMLLESISTQIYNKCSVGVPRT